MRTYPVRRPLCVAVCAFIAGLWLGGLSAPSSRILYVLVTLAVVMGALFLMSTQKDRRMAIAIVAFGAGICFMHTALDRAEMLTPLEGTQVQFHTTILSAPSDKTYVDATVHQVDGKTLTHPVKVRIKRHWNDNQSYETGSDYRFSGVLDTPAVQTNPGGYDEALILQSRGIRTVLNASEAGVFLAPPEGFMARINAFRLGAQDILTRHLSNGEQALVRATLFSDTADLNDDFYNISQEYGIIHIFSVSGLHVGFLLAFVLGVARLLRRQHSWTLLILLIPLLTVYATLSNGSPSAVRASVMAILGLFIARMLRYRDPFTLIALTALALLIAEPFNLWRIGFQLSFAAVLGIYLLAPRLEQLFIKLPKWLSGALSVAVAAELFTFPLSAWYFYLFAPLSVVMNLLVVPFFSLLVPLALLAIVLTAIIPALGVLCFFPVRVLIFAILAIMNLINHFVGTLHCYIGQPPLWLMLVYYLILLLVFRYPFREKRTRCFSIALTAVAALGILCCPAVSKDLRLTVVDVGQGSGATYQTASGDWLVFDTGPSSDTVARYLRYCGVNTVEGIVLSHADSDHITGMAHILRDCRVRTIFASQAAQNSDAWQTLTPYLTHTKVVTIDSEAHYTLGDAKLTLNLISTSTDADEANANEVVALLTENHKTILFPGDTDADHLNELPQTTTLSVLLLPHHGSKYSWDTDYFRRHPAQLAIASAGRHNRFNHPHPDTIAGLSELHIPLLRTDQNGAIRLYDKDGQWLIQPYIVD